MSIMFFVHMFSVCLSLCFCGLLCSFFLFLFIGISQAREAIDEQLAIGERLRQKMQSLNSDSESDGKSSDSDSVCVLDELIVNLSWDHDTFSPNNSLR